MGWIYFIIVAIILASIIAGQSSAPSNSTGGKNCKECEADFTWYRSLSNVKKATYSVWWAARKIACAANGC
jgi:hypothetical protein